MQHQLINLTKCEKGATALEYGLLAALIAATIAAGVTSIGIQINATFSTLANILNAALSNF